MAGEPCMSVCVCRSEEQRLQVSRALIDFLSLPLGTGRRGLSSLSDSCHLSVRVCRSEEQRLQVSRALIDCVPRQSTADGPCLLPLLLPACLSVRLQV
jgi:5-carboxymethyl-2-hydroxymuconate isomerase